MALTAQLADGRTLEFPDGTAPEVIQATVKKMIAAGGATPAPAAPAKPAPTQPDDAEMIAGTPAARFALGAASPVLGLAQLADEATGGNLGVSSGLRRLDEMKKRGMTPAAELKRLEEGRAILARLPGYEAQLASIDKEIAGIRASGSSADPKDAGFDLAGTAGAVMSPASLAAMKIPAAATVLGRSGQGIAVGAGFGAAAPVTEGENYWGSKGTQVGTGAALGGVIPPAIDAGKAVVTAGRNFIDPWLPGGIDRAVGRTANEAAGSKRDAVIAALQQNREIVPGSLPNAGQAAAPAGSAEFSGLQRAVEYRRPSEAVARSTAQEGARRNAVGAIAGTPDDLANAVRARGAAAATNYGAAAPVTVQADDALNSLLSRPSMEKAVARAKELAKEKGVSFDPSKVESLHFVKMAMDDLTGNPERFGIGAAEARAISGTQRQFIEWLGQKSPAYDAARTAYKADSVPINRMEVGRELEKSLTSAIGKERASTFANAVQEAPRTIKRATGQPRYESLDEVLAPNQVQSVRNIVDDLKRDAQHNELADAGIARARELLGQMAPKAPAAGMFNPKYSVARALVNRLEGRVTEKGVARMAELMENPQEMARLMRNASPADAAVIEALLAQKLGRGAIVYGTMGASGQEQF